MKIYIAVGIGGIIGSSLRLLVSLLFTADNFTTFPWATFIVNISGAFLLTFILFLPWIETKIQPMIVTALTTGIIGSYTTFSAITVEVVMLWQHSVMIASLYFMLTITCGLFSSFGGFKMARKLAKKGRII